MGQWKTENTQYGSEYYRDRRGDVASIDTIYLIIMVKRE
jgi:hypothetical protein